MVRWMVLAVAVFTGVSAAPAAAQIRIGVTVSATGPAAALGIPERNTFQFAPSTIAGQKVEYIVLDDASDPTRARQNAEKFVNEDKVDLVIGSTTTPNSLAMIEVVATAQTPMISLGASARIVEPLEGMRTWVFKTPQSDAMMASAVAQDMADRGFRNIAFIGFNDAFGDSWWAEFQKYAELRKLKIVAYERYGRTDTSVTAQVLKVIGANPDAILVAAYGTPAALPQITLKERGYRGQIYHGHGILNNDFLRVAGANAHGILAPAGPVLVAVDLPDTNPIKKVSLDYKRRYEAAHGAGSLSAFGAHAWDAILLAERAIPGALKRARPGTPEFRKALRDEIEAAKDLIGTHGIFNMSAQDHLGLDQRARLMIRIEDGKWRLAAP